MQDHEELLRYVERMHERTRRVSLCITEEALEHTFAPGRFTLAGTVRHLAAINRYMFVENAAGRGSRYSADLDHLASGLEETLALQECLHTEGMDILRSLPSERFTEPCTTPGGAQMPVWKWLRSMCEHEAHHRGQIYWMLGSLGIATPPLFGLTSEQVAARSSGA